METIKTNDPNLNPNTPKAEDEKSLKGTMISVGFVLAFIIVSWVAVFSLYMSRV